MRKVKTEGFESYNVANLQKQLNTWLENNDFEIISILYSSCSVSDTGNLNRILIRYSAVITYNQQPDKCLVEFTCLFNNRKGMMSEDKYESDYITIDLNEIVAYNPSSIKDNTTIEMKTGGRYSLEMNYGDFKLMMKKYNIEK